MNEKIKALSQQAGAIGIWNNHMPFQGMIDLDKFAGLIIQECLGIVEAENGRRIGEIDIGLLVKEHFGVKR
jgi:hypothetical protein